MAVKVAINGFGRIGRLAFRQMFGHEGSEIVAINDLTSPDMLAYLLKYDSTQGNYARDHEVVAGEDSITVDGKEIKIYKEADANNLPWGDLDVDVVLECTGFYTSKAKAQAHINAGAKKVVISAPAGSDLPTIVYNVNHETLTAEDKANLAKWTQSTPTTVSLKEWHTLTVRTTKDVVETSIDGKVVSSFQSPGVAHDHKTVVSLTTNRVDVDYDDFSIKGVAKP